MGRAGKASSSCLGVVFSCQSGCTLTQRTSDYYDRAPSLFSENKVCYSQHFLSLTPQFIEKFRWKQLDGELGCHQDICLVLSRHTLSHTFFFSHLFHYSPHRPRQAVKHRQGQIQVLIHTLKT